MTLTSTFKSKTYFIDPAHNRSAIQTTVSYASKFPPFVENEVKQNGKIYIWVQWFNINPSPCFYEISNTGNSLWNQPTLIPLGTMQASALGTVNLYTTGIDINQVWFYNQKSQPIGVLDLVDRDPAGPAIVSGYQPSTPDPSHFTIPTSCFPIQNGTFDFSSKRDITTAKFPMAFTMYYSGVKTDHMFSTQSFFYDATTSTIKIRIDAEGYTTLQIGNYIYYFVRDDDGVLDINPLPCVVFEDVPNIWQPPNFSRLLANVTIDGFPNNGIYSAPSPTGLGLLQYWYFSSDGIPLYFMDSNYIMAKVSFFQASPPPSGVFDIPAQCNIVDPQSKRK